MTEERGNSRVIDLERFFHPDQVMFAIEMTISGASVAMKEVELAAHHPQRRHWRDDRGVHPGLQLTHTPPHERPRG